MKISRRNLSLGAIGTYAAIGLRYPAGAAEFSYKWATDVATDHPISVRSIEAGARITQETNGRLDLRVFPNATLGGSAQMLAQVRLGAIEFLSSSDAVNEGIVQASGLTAIPFTFATHKDAWNAADGSLGKYVRNAIAGAGLYAFDRSWDAGFRQITNRLRPIRTPADVKGLKIRVPDSPIVASLFKALGATATALTGTEMYTALQTRLVDGTEVPLVVVETRKLFEVEKYVSMTNQVWSGYMVVANPGSISQLPKSIRDVVDRHVNAAALRSREDIIRLDSSLEAQLKGQGVVFTQPDIPAFRAAVRASGFYAEWRDHYGPEAWAILEKTVGPLR